MGNIPQVITAFNCFVDGNSYSGMVNKATIPPVVFETVEKSVAGYAGDIDVLTGRVGKMESDIEFDSFAAAAIFGMLGNANASDKPVVMRGSVASGGNHLELKITMQGTWKEWGGVELSAKAEVNNKFKVSLTKLVVEVDGKELIYINLPTFDTRVNGNDIGAKIKANLGL